MDGHFRLQDFEEVPTDGFAFAVLVRRQVEGVGLLELVLEQLDLFALARRDDVDRREIVVDVDAQVRPRLALVLGRNLLGALRQVAHVADAGLDREAASEVLADRLRLGGRFDDHQGVTVVGGLRFGCVLFGHIKWTALNCGSSTTSAICEG